MATNRFITFNVQHDKIIKIHMKMTFSIRSKYILYFISETTGGLLTY